jgi:hypothetical protein
MLDLLRRFIDSIEYRKEEAEKRRKREALPPDQDPDLVDVVVPPSPAGAPEPTLVCRICAHAGTGPYCPVCLAETMVAPPAGDPR